jgi:hypothetical protein
VVVASASAWIDHLRAHRPAAEFPLADRLEDQPAGSGRNFRQERAEKAINWEGKACGRNKNEARDDHGDPHLRGISPGFIPSFTPSWQTGSFDLVGSSIVSPGQELKALEEIFRFKVLTTLRAEGRITDGLIEKLMAWWHSGFSVHVGNRIAKDDR